MPETDVLVLEDEDQVREMLMEVIERAGYRSVALGNAAEGVARLPELQPKVILLDMSMPGMDGFEFLARLRADARWASIRVLIISSLGEELGGAIDLKGRHVLGIAGVYPKPAHAFSMAGHLEAVVGPGSGCRDRR